MSRLSKTRILSFILTTCMFIMPACSTALPQPISTVTLSAPMETPEPIFTPTVRSTLAPSLTPSPYPTWTPTPLPIWITEFAEPILAAIADRPPDIQEDFSEEGPNWYLEKVNCPNDGCSLSDGVLSMVAYPVENKEGWAGQPFPCCSGFKTFVLRVDVNTANLHGENAANIAYNDTRWESGRFTVVFTYNFELKSGRRWYSLIGPSGKDGGGSGKLAPWAPQQITFTLISMGSRFAVYLNDIPVTFGEYDGGQYQPEFSLNAWSAGSAPARVEYDNLMIWNLDNIPNLP